MLVCFELNFAANFCFTLFNGVRIYEPLWLPASYFFKTLYHITLVIGVFAWCGYAETEHGSDLFETLRKRRLATAPALLPIAEALANLWNHKLFYISDTGRYVRDFMFHWQMVLLIAVSAFFAVRVLCAAGYESDPNKKAHMRLISSFPLCIVAAWVLSFVGEAVPVICVSVTVELLCLYMGTSRQQISVDKLTQVNNRQNLIGFMKYKLRIHEGPLYLLMMDVDYFKKINDTYGHLEGDRAQTTVAGVLKLYRPLRRGRVHDYPGGHRGGGRYPLPEHPRHAPCGRGRPGIRAQGQHRPRLLERGNGLQGADRRGRRGAL